MSSYFDPFFFLYPLLVQSTLGHLRYEPETLTVFRFLYLQQSWDDGYKYINYYKHLVNNTGSVRKTNPSNVK